MSEKMKRNVGAQPGNVNAMKNKRWADAIHKVCTDKELEHLAKVLVEDGKKGNMAAIKEIGDRLDGRPQQSIQSESTSYKVVVGARDQITEQLGAEMVSEESLGLSGGGEKRH